MLPRGPFVETGGGRFAYVVEDGVAERRPIRMGGDQRFGGRDRWTA